MRARHTELLEANNRFEASPPTASEAREFNFLDHALRLYESLEARKQEALDLKSLMAEEDAEMAKEAERELLEVVEPAVSALEADFVGQLLPKEDEDVAGSALLEIRAGAGGDEASAFAGLLLDMYTNYASLRNWKFETLDASRSEYGGVKTAFALVKGPESYASLQFESGTHRIQRVPSNATKIHTSTASVVVFPQTNETDSAHIKEVPASELKIDTYRAGGAGGQHVNTTDSAVRMTHIPTGIQVAMQDERSQHQNRKKALRVITARVNGFQAEKDRQARNKLRDTLSGTGERSERVRTYNFQHDRVVDHRSHYTANSVQRTLEGPFLHDILQSLKLQQQDDRLQAFLNSDGKDQRQT